MIEFKSFIVYTSVNSYGLPVNLVIVRDIELSLNIKYPSVSSIVVKNALLPLKNARCNSILIPLRVIYENTTVDEFIT